jgi:shikimate kinase
MSLIFLVGYMGCGKTTLAKKLASKLSYEWLDTDVFIEKQEGVSVSEIFTKYGETYFRSLELKLIQSLDISKPMVVSTGGGLPCFNNLMEILNKKGTTIYLERSPKELFKRLQQGKSKRPLLANKSDQELLQFIEENLEKRNPIYRQSNYILDRDYQTVDKIINLLNL